MPVLVGACVIVASYLFPARHQCCTQFLIWQLICITILTVSSTKRSTKRVPIA